MQNNKTINSYLIRCLSPTHPGAGDSSHGIIDNLVQRDYLTGYPCIYGSSLKGALREFFKYNLEGSSYGKLAGHYLNRIFGSEKTDQPQEFNAGLFSFDEASLISLPVRSSKHLYVNATTPALIQQTLDRLLLYQRSFFTKEASTLIEALKEFNMNFSEGLSRIIAVPGKELKDAILEEFDFKVEEELSSVDDLILKLFGEKLVVVPDEKFKVLVKALPIVARNKLTNGQSENLFYEELLPRETRFITFVISRDLKEDAKLTEKDDLPSIVFSNIINADFIIQIGANASIGYGKTKFAHLFKLEANGQ